MASTWSCNLLRRYHNPCKDLQHVSSWGDTQRYNNEKQQAIYSDARAWLLQQDSCHELMHMATTCTVELTAGVQQKAAHFVWLTHPFLGEKNLEERLQR